MPPAVPSARPGPPRLRVAEPEQLRPELAAVYQAMTQRRAGMPGRDERWWRARMDDPEWARDGSSPLRWMIAEDDAGPRGYASYSVRPDWGSDGNAAGQLDVHELMATDPEAAAALWTDLLTRDLVSEVRAWLRPADEELLYMLAGRRRARVSATDGLWIRLLDLPAALGQRRYSRELDVVIEVTDELLPGNSGRWRLSAGAAGQGTCERTTRAPDVLMPVQALGAAYLGGTRLGALAAAGQVAQERPGALAELSAAMAWDPAPWCPAIF
jgi:predicted acetyltransferase